MAAHSGLCHGPMAGRLSLFRHTMAGPFFSRVQETGPPFRLIVLIFREPPMRDKVRSHPGKRRELPVTAARILHPVVVRALEGQGEA